MRYMREQESLPDPQSIVAGVEAFYDSMVLPEFTALPQTPPNLIRRFVFRRHPNGLITLSDDLPEEPASRLFGAFCCADSIIHAGQPGWVDPITYDFWFTPCDPHTFSCTLTPNDMRVLYQHSRDELLNHGSAELVGDFDLHDAYVCVEEYLLSRYHWRTDYGKGYYAPGVDLANERYITQLESVLQVIGQATGT